MKLYTDAVFLRELYTKRIERREKQETIDKSNKQTAVSRQIITKSQSFRGVTSITLAVTSIALAVTSFWRDVKEVSTYD